MHVGVEETVAKRLGEKNLDPVVGKLLHVHAGGAQGLDLADRNSVDALHGQHLAPGQIPVDLRNVQQRGTFEVGLEAAGIAGLVAQIEFLVNGAVELVDHLHRPQATCIRRIADGHARHRVQQGNIALDHRRNARAQHLHRHLGAIVQARQMHLRHRGRGDRRAIEGGKVGRQRHTERALDNGRGLLARERRHLVLEFRQFQGDILGQQVRAGGQHLPEFHEHRAERLEGLAQAPGAWRLAARQPVPGCQQAQQNPVGTKQMDGGHELVEVVAHEHARDAQQARDLADRPHGFAPRARCRRCSKRSRSSRRRSTSFRKISTASRRASRRASSRKYSAASCASVPAACRP